MSRRFGFVFMLGVVLVGLITALAGCSGVAGSSPGGSTGSNPATNTVASAAAQVAHITLSDQQITADRSTFTAEQPYQFVVTNTGQIAHEFMMAPWGMDYGHMSWDQRQHASMYAYDQVAPGQTRTFMYTFPASAVGHSYGFGCYQEGSHDGDHGMWYAFSVQAHP